MQHIEETLEECSLSELVNEIEQLGDKGDGNGPHRLAQCIAQEVESRIQNLEGEITRLEAKLEELHVNIMILHGQVQILKQTGGPHGS